jgi:hypothetical protein
MFSRKCEWAAVAVTVRSSHSRSRTRALHHRDPTAMRSRIYVDTSVFGGCEDVEFLDHSRSLGIAMAKCEYAMVVSEVTLSELEKAPVPWERTNGPMPSI